jgi:hypothetical protein
MLVMELASTTVASPTSKDATQATADRSSVAWPGFSAALQQKLSQACQAESKQGGHWHTRWLDAQGRPVFTKPLFISIGYASCHWCHVMARESFESAAEHPLIGPDSHYRHGGAR